MQSLSSPNQLPTVDIHMASFWSNMLCPRNWQNIPGCQERKLASSNCLIIHFLAMLTSLSEVNHVLCPGHRLCLRPLASAGRADAADRREMDRFVEPRIQGVWSLHLLRLVLSELAHLPLSPGPCCVFSTDVVSWAPSTLIWSVSHSLLKSQKYRTYKPPATAHDRGLRKVTSLPWVSGFPF